MDPILDPAKVQLFASYADHHELFDLFESLVKAVVVEQPPDPLQFMIDFLKVPQLPAIVVCGPPRCAISKIAEKISIIQNAVFISVNTLLLSAIERQSSLGQQARPYMERGQLVPDQIILNLVLQRLQEPDISLSGFVIEGFPATKEQAAAFQMKGIFLTSFVWIDCEDEAIMQYNSEILTDPVMKKEYHPKYNPPPQDAELISRLVNREYNARETVSKRLSAYRRSIPPVAACFQKAGVCVRFKYMDSDGVWGRQKQVVDEVVRSALGMKGATRAPRQFRVVVQGMPGSGRSSLAAEIERKYAFVHVSPKKIILEEMSSKSRLSQTLKEYIHSPEEIPDDLLLDLIVKRLQQPDCMNQGWVLEGFPNSKAQAAALTERNIHPNRLIWLNASQEQCALRLTSRRQDPLTGKLANLSAPQSTLPTRLETIETWPKRDMIADADENVLARIQKRSNLKSEMETAYGYRKKVVGKPSSAAANADSFSGIMQEVNAEGIGEKDSRGRHVGLERLLEHVDDLLMKPVPAVLGVHGDMDFAYSQDEVDSLLSSLISSPSGPDSGNASGEESETGKRFEMAMTQEATCATGIAMHSLGADVLNTDDLLMGGMAMGIESLVPISVDSVLGMGPAFTLPPQSDTVRAALSSDNASECLALLAGPVKKKPGRKKNQPDVKLEEPTPIQSTQRKKAKSSPPTDIPKSLASSNHDQSVSILPAKPPVPIMPSASTSSFPISISPTPAIDSKRKLSFSAADYLTPTNTAFSPNNTSYNPPQMPLSATSPTSTHSSPPPTISLTPAVTVTAPAVPAASSVPALTKHQERMMKNRASADESRKKHKEHVEKLENMCRELLKENSVLRTRVLEVEAWAEHVGAAANASAAASAAATANFDSLFKADPLLGSGNLCSGNLKRTASDAFMGVDMGMDGLQSTAVEAMDNAFFDFFFGSANASSAGTGTVMMAFLFSFSLFMFPSSLFQGTHFFNSNGAQSSDLSVKTPVFNGLSHYLPRVLQEPSPTDSIESSYNPYFKATLDAPPRVNSIDPRPPSELLVVHPQSSGLIQLPFLRISNRAVATRAATTGYTMPTPGAHANSKRVPYFVPIPLPHPQKQTTNESSESFKSVTPRVCAMQEVLDWVLGEIEWHVPGADTAPSKSEAVANASPTATTAKTQNSDTQSQNNQNPFSSDAGGSPKVTHAPKIRVSKERWDALHALLSIPDEKSGNESTSAVFPTAFAASNNEVPSFVTTTRSALSGVATILPPPVLNGRDTPLTTPKAVVVVGAGTPPIRSNDERASVKRRNLARGAMGPPKERVIVMDDAPAALPKEDVVVFREGAQLVDRAVTEQQQLGNLFGEEGGAYCAVKNGPILQIAADLTDHEGEMGVDEEGYRLMLDVQVIGAKLVRF
ncbi:adenylate kinase [Chytriomyces confervae]|uniref:Adenylate kinase n=1 Tax=Chytriomyces confervae TaxID=246404 RepID=A0A507FNU8_9FUNG|nr:adenylate kinase [Chytriomyces confervae]